MRVLLSILFGLIMLGGIVMGILNGKAGEIIHTAPGWLWYGVALVGGIGFALAYPIRRSKV